MPRKKATPTPKSTEQPDTVVEPMADGKAMVLTTDGIGDQPPTGQQGDDGHTIDVGPVTVGEQGPQLEQLPAGSTVSSSGDTGLVDTAPADEAPATGCQLAPDCAQAGRAPWKFHTDKDGQRTTATEANGAFWNRSCPADGCNVRVFLA